MCENLDPYTAYPEEELMKCIPTLTLGKMVTKGRSVQIPIFMSKKHKKNGMRIYILVDPDDKNAPKLTFNGVQFKEDFGEKESNPDNQKPGEYKTSIMIPKGHKVWKFFTKIMEKVNEELWKNNEAYAKYLKRRQYGSKPEEGEINKEEWYYSKAKRNKQKISALSKDEMDDFTFSFLRKNIDKTTGEIAVGKDGKPYDDFIPIRIYGNPKEDWQKTVFHEYFPEKRGRGGTVYDPIDFIADDKVLTFLKPDPNDPNDPVRRIQNPPIAKTPAEKRVLEKKAKNKKELVNTNRFMKFRVLVIDLRYLSSSKFGVSPQIFGRKLFFIRDKSNEELKFSSPDVQMELMNVIDEEDEEMKDSLNNDNPPPPHQKTYNRNNTYNTGYDNPTYEPQNHVPTSGTLVVKTRDSLTDESKTSFEGHRQKQMKEKEEKIKNKRSTQINKARSDEDENVDGGEGEDEYEFEDEYYE